MTEIRKPTENQLSETEIVSLSPVILKELSIRMSIVKNQRRRNNFDIKKLKRILIPSLDDISRHMAFALGDFEYTVEKHVSTELVEIGFSRFSKSDSKSDILSDGIRIRIGKQSGISVKNVIEYHQQMKSGETTRFENNQETISKARDFIAAID